jgi:hypothetical protein
MKIKRKSSPGKISFKKKSGSDFSLPDFSLNIIIILLSLIIIYISYSIVNKLVNRQSEDTLMSKIQKPSEIIQLEVLNGCGAGGVGDRFTNFLRTNKFDVVNVSNYISFDVDKTLVIDRTGNLENAKKVASALGISKDNVVQQINRDYFLDVSLIIGKDYNQLKPYK